MAEAKTFPGPVVRMDASAQEHGVLFVADDGEVIFRLDLGKRNGFWAPYRITDLREKAERPTHDPDDTGRPVPHHGSGPARYLGDDK